ncbi:MAG: ribonuclease M5 [Tissierellia bacterium]|nr:ribonuclease M5 [Tissierellia bacterium]
MKDYSIREVIVVEGTMDIVAVKRALGEVDCIATHGLGLDESFLERLSQINDRQGIIVLTDPDFAGKKIRQKIRDYIPQAKHAYISRDQARKFSDVGVENASDQAIISAIEKARPELVELEDRFSYRDIVEAGLTGSENSRKKRQALCDALNIEYSNAKQLVTRLNVYGISRQEFEEALRGLDEKR